MVDEGEVDALLGARAQKEGDTLQPTPLRIAPFPVAGVRLRR